MRVVERGFDGALLDRERAAIGMVVMDRKVDRGVRDLRQRVAEHRLRGRIDEDRITTAVDKEQGRGHGVRNGSQQPVLVAEPLLLLVTALEQQAQRRSE